MMFRDTLLGIQVLVWLALMLPASAAWSQDDKAATATQNLKQRLKQFEEQAARIRQEMLKEVDAEARKIEAAIKKAQEEEEKANKVNDRAAAAKARQTAWKLRQSQYQLELTRRDIERRIDVAPVKTPDEAERLGIHATVPSSTLVSQLGLTREQGTVGMVLVRVAKDSAAAKAGLQVHDVLIQLDGQPVPSDAAKFKKLLSEIKPGTAVEAVVLRQGKQQNIAGLTIPPVSTQPAAGDRSSPTAPSEPVPRP